jgi:hypothetical protein
MSNDGSPEDQLIGAVTGGYRLLANIGSGAMGHVYDAEEIKTSSHVALKVLRKSHKKELAARFIREGKTLALLSHPNIVQLVDMGQLDDGALFLATELVPGGSLRALMDRGPIDPRRALRLVRQLLAALQAAHDLGVVHRDIKPENVMVTDGDVVKVLDFGVAKLLQDTVAGLGEANLTSVGFSVFGSAHYIAPECVVGNPVDARIDIYSTGAMLFEMLAGRPPFDNEDPLVILRAHAGDPPPTLKQAAPGRSFAPELEAIVGRALAKRPEDRFGSATDMITALDEVLKLLEPPTPTPQPAGIIAARLDGKRRATTEVVKRPNRGMTFAIAGVGAAVALAIVVIATHGESADAKRSDVGTTSPANRTTPAQAPSLLARGHERFAQGKLEDALAAYERALRATPTLGSDPTLRANLTKVVESNKEVLAMIVALDLLASLTPPAYETITTYASSGKLEPARHRAVMLAERDGVDIKIDRVQSWILDLQQATSCEDRKEAIARLVQQPDRRALAILKRTRSVKCVEQEATDAITRIESAAK